MSFQPGERVTMRHSHRWEFSRRGLTEDGVTPVFGEIYEVREVGNLINGEQFIHLRGFVDEYWDERFRPVVEPKLPESITACLKTDHKQREPALT